VLCFSITVDIVEWYNATVASGNVPDSVVLETNSALILTIKISFVGVTNLEMT